jgi:hypothetical protein
MCSIDDVTNLKDSGVVRCENIEAKRQQNIEDNRRFLAALKINDVS